MITKQLIEHMVNFSDDLVSQAQNCEMIDQYYTLSGEMMKQAAEHSRNSNYIQYFIINMLLHVEVPEN